MRAELSPALETSALPLPGPPVSRRWPPGDVVAVAVLLALPVLVFGVPALLGHPVLPGDDLSQNYPLRVLAGQQIRSGQLPLYDPYIWSGAPLLGGWNAGAAYPLTLLFAIVPAAAAWTLNLIVTWAVAGAGMFAFLRALGGAAGSGPAQRLRSLPSFLGALSFTFAGAMSAQVGHFGLVAGMGWVPLQLLAVLRLSETRGIASRLRWTAVLAAAAGLTILAGEPRAIDDACAVVVIYAGWQILRLGRRCGPAAISVAAGAALGVCLGAVQWLPGLAAISTSQRAVGSAALFDSGSLPHKWLLLMLVPDLLGGSGSFGQPGYFAHYNLAEVTGYVGILPLVAAFALLGRVRLRPRPPEWLVWHVMALAGVILALGGNTPAGHLLMHVPLFGDQRLQSRNILVADLALAVLLAYWADQPLSEQSEPLSEPGRPLGQPGQQPGRADGARRRHLETLLGVLPALAMIAVVVLGLSWGAGLLHWMGVGPSAAAGADRLKPWLIPYALLGGGAIALVIASRRLEPRLRWRWLSGFVVLDVVVFTLLSVVAVRPGFASPTATPGRGTRAASVSTPGTGRAPAVRPVAALGRPGRFAIYDPGEFATHDLPVLGSPDLNVISATPSVQGYSSIVDGRYAAATGSHLATGEGQDVLSPRAIGSGILDQLGTTSLLTIPGYLITAEKRALPAPGPPGTGNRHVAADHQGTWYFATQLAVSRLEVPDSDARQDAATGTQIGLVTPGGPTRWFNADAASASLLEIRLRHPVTSVAMAGRAGGKPCLLGPPSIAVPGGRVFVADGQLQNALVPPRWGFAGHDGSFAVFADHLAASSVSLRALPGRSASGASVRQVTGPAAEPTAAEVSSPHGVRVVRAVAAIPGWSATWRPRGGTAVTLAVRRAGLVQAVDVPPGSGVVTWSYVPPGFRMGFALSLSAALLLLLLLLAAPARSACRAYWRHARSPAPHRH